MKVLKGIKFKIAQYLLNRRYRSTSRNREIKNISRCRSVLVIGYDVEDPEGLEMSRFLQYLKRNNCDISALLFKNLKEIEKTQSAQIKIFGLLHLNKILIPIDNEVIQLLNREFDLLIDLSIGESFPLKYIHAMSKSKFKVGAATNYKKQFGDLTIDVSKNPTTAYLITQMKHYLTLINREEHAA